MSTAKRKSTHGRARSLTPEQLKDRTRITRRDVEVARDAWRAVAPVRFKNLIDAKERAS